MDKSNYTGSCLCGELRYEVSGRFKYLCNCYCRSCQLASGAPYVAWGTACLLYTSDAADEMSEV